MRRIGASFAGFLSSYRSVRVPYRTCTTSENDGKRDASQETPQPEPEPLDPRDIYRVEDATPIPDLSELNILATPGGVEAYLKAKKDEGAQDAVVLDEKKDPPVKVNHPKGESDKVIPKKKVRYVSSQEQAAIDFQKMIHGLSQEGPYIGSKKKSQEKTSVDSRKRREIERVTPFKAPWQGYETSFRRLPKGYKLPNEWELRGAYPCSTTLKIEWDEADCADYNMHDVMEAPQPIKFGKLLPPNYDPKKKYPYMVALADWRNLETDVEDVCAHFFERPNINAGLREQEFVVFFPLISGRHSVIVPVEGVVAKFCDWVTSKFNVENGLVHLWGKGLGGNTALRTILYQKNVCISCTAIMGRISAPFRPTDRPMERTKNLNGVHILMIVPGGMRKVDYPYRFKAMCDIAQIEPPIRCLHYAEVRDAQITYALNPYEFWSHMKFFRTTNGLTVKQPLQHDDDDPSLYSVDDDEDDNPNVHPDLISVEETPKEEGETASGAEASI